MEQNSRELTYGEKLVGLDFNPSGDQRVQRVKELCAELTDIVNNHRMSRESTQLSTDITAHAIGEILNAQMCAVKVLTFKH